MTTRSPRRRSPTRGPALDTAALVSAIPLGLVMLVVAILAFAQASARVGLTLPLFEPLGHSFHAWEGPLKLAEAAAVTRTPPPRHLSPQLIAQGQSALASEPLSSNAIRAIGLGRDLVGDRDGARRAMRAADAMSRRDGVAQLWLINDAIRRNRPAETLAHYDALLRTTPEVGEQLLVQLAAVLPVPEARAILRSYMVGHNPWLEPFLGVAVARAPRSAPIAQLVIETGRMPDQPLLRERYAGLVERLARENEFGLLRRVYPLLPGSSAESLTSVSLSRATTEQGYAPVTWKLASEADWGGALVPIAESRTPGLEFYALPDTRGTTGSKIITLDPARQQMLTWRLVERSRNDRASARWTARCVAGSGSGSVVRSENLALLAEGRAYRLRLPGGCAMIVLSMQVAGGVGRDPATFIVDRLTVRPAA